MFKYEFNAISRDFCYNEYLEYLEVVNPESRPVSLQTYNHLIKAFDSDMQDQQGEN